MSFVVIFMLVPTFSINVTNHFICRTSFEKKEIISTLSSINRMKTNHVNTLKCSLSEYTLDARQIKYVIKKINTKRVWENNIFLCTPNINYLIICYICTICYHCTIKIQKKSFLLYRSMVVQLQISFRRPLQRSSPNSCPKWSPKCHLGHHFGVGHGTLSKVELRWSFRTWVWRWSLKWSR